MNADITAQINALVADIKAADNELASAPRVIADRRAQMIEKAIALLGRGGRDTLAAALGLKVNAIDAALRRARGLTRPTGLDDTSAVLDQLYKAERSGLPPLAAHQWRILAHVLSGTWVDAFWIESGPGRLLAADIEDSDLLDTEEAQRLAAVCRSWTRVQGLAAVTALLHGDFECLPAKDAQ
jgi:hypothetical protein